MKLYGLIIAMGLLLLAACAGPTPAPPPASTVTATIASTATPLPAVTATPAPDISPEAAAYLEAAIVLVEANGLNRLKLEWEVLRAKAYHDARHAQTPADTYGIIQWLLQQAGGNHSFFVPPTAASEAQQSTVSDSPPPRVKLLPNGLGYVAIEGFSSATTAEEVTYATLVQQLIRDVDAQAPCGWIVDLRENTGGNMWPMLAGIGPILGEGVAGAFVDPEGLQEAWSYANGQAFIDDEVQAQVDGPVYALRAADPPVAVLTGINTASSGEAVAIAFRGRPLTRSFGHYTNGLTTANQGFPLNDGAWMILTSAVMADRTGQAYGEEVHPDEIVDDVRQFTMLMDEAIPRPAIDWLLAQPACTAQ